MSIATARREEGFAPSSRRDRTVAPPPPMTPRDPLRRRRRIGLAFTVPSLVFVGIVMAYPLFYLVFLAFHTYRPLRSAEVTPAGLSNFIALFTDSAVANSLAVTLQFTVASVLLEVVIGTLCAVLLATVMLGSRSRGGRLYSRLLGSAYIIPFAVPAIAGAYAWRMLLDAQFGPVNAALGTSTPWLVEHPLLAIIVIDAWKMMPFVIFVMLAAVMSIEPTQYEAAALDGAGALRQLLTITLPSILPIMVITAAFRAVDAFTKVFDTVFATTGGGPGDDTRVFPLLIWRTAFTHLDFGAASAQALAALAISLVFGIALLVSQRRNAR
ncbi:sugar ABC transport system, permease protein [Microbacterium esteraromaticum]|uniref:Sugar ABC transport system, permease protein n=1 Tax=Microbacterium esteraromaticum TaxID=57043 RepID=A0A1R4KHJ2_9MICO|nr:sugar ABC transporter permease [Microbacterium esteraromaticum]SJN43791.1 sugar ABC transport system, permease protein [Microbacterium esteraromaticum]